MSNAVPTPSGPGGAPAKGRNWGALIIPAILVVFAIVFIIMNNFSARIWLFVWIDNLPVWLVFVLVLLIGAVFGYVIGKKGKKKK